MTHRRSRSLRLLVMATAALMLTACTGLPTSGEAQSGLALGASPEDTDFLPVASGPVEGAGPEAIVEGFMDAAITPADNWETARTFLTPQMAETWRPSTGVSIDVSASARAVDAGEEDADALQDGDSLDVRVGFDQVASVDATGAYTESIAASTSSFVVTRVEGQWRISDAPDGVVIDAERFSQVYDDYALQYYDQSWQRLVPDVRWFPRRATIATTIAQSLISGAPSPWLDPAVQSAFPPGVELARDAVPIDPDQVADVALNRSALSLDPTTLARMRTQLQATFTAGGLQISQVRLTVDGRTLEAGVAKVVEDTADAGSIVLRDGEFGTMIGGQVMPVEGVSAGILAITDPITAIDVSAAGALAAVQLDDGHVYVVRNGSIDELDQRDGLVRPTLDPYEYTWSVPSNAPTTLRVISPGVDSIEIPDAWPDASTVSAIRVSADGARLAATVVIGGERWMVVSAILRDDTGAPTGVGPMQPLTQIDGAAQGLVWVSPTRLGAIMDLDDRSILTQMVGGTGTDQTAPSGTVSIAGSRSPAGLRVLAADGGVYAPSGSAWSEGITGVAVLATRAGH